MYHCHTRFYLVGPLEKDGEENKLFGLIKELKPFRNYTHEFITDISPNEELASKADVIFADISESGDILPTLILNKKIGAELIVIAKHEQSASLSDIFKETDDIWISPMSDAEMSFRINKWHKAFKASKDSWLYKQYLDSVINSTPNLVWFKDIGGIHHKVNNSFCKTVNKSKKQIEGRTHAYIWGVESDDPACVRSEADVINFQKTKISKETVTSSDGVKILTTYKSPLYDIDGSVMGTVGIGIDITQNQAYEQEITKKSKTLETIFTTLDCGILCHSIDGSQILNINAAALKILGYETKEELLEDGFKSVAMSVMDEDKPKLRGCIQKLKKENDSVSVEYRVQHKNGDIIHVMGNVKLMRENGELFYQRFLLDCTDQKLREKKERDESEKHYTDLIQALGVDYIIICYYNLTDGNGNLLRASGKINKELTSIFGGDITFSQSMNDYIDRFVCEENKEELRAGISCENINHELSEKNAYYINYRAYNDLNEYEYYQMKVVRIGSSDKKNAIVIGVRSVHEEIRQQMEKKAILENALTQANKANEAKSTFLSNMSHDIRTPMNAIVGFTNLAIDHIDQRSRVEEYLDKIRLSGNHLLGLLNDVLDMSHIESNKMNLEVSESYLSEILHDLCNMLQANIRTKSLSFEIDASDIAHEKIFCDKTRVNQVLLNILSNAIKYTPSGGEIYFSITEIHFDSETGVSKYKFVISDTGIGMSEEFLKHIFEPFERERNTTHSKIQGTGLGMAITKKIVEMMSGEIDIKSKQGEGTSVAVTFDFPIINDAENYIIPRLKGQRALVINEDRAVCEKICGMLSRTGMRADWTMSPKEAVIRTHRRANEQDGFSVYIINHDKENSWSELVENLRGEPDTSGSIIILTAYGCSEIEDEAFKAGVNAVCYKPVFLTDIKQSLLSSLNREEEEKEQASCLMRHGRILLAEDNDLNYEIAIAILSDAGYDVELAENGELAVNMVEKSEPGYYQLILMDIQMPIMNGFEASKAIRKLKNPILSKIPIVAMTANAFEEDRREALKSGMNGYISKPIDITNLFEVLDKILG